MRVACLQLNVELCRREDNARRALDMVRMALERGAKVLVFPELFLTGFCYKPQARDSPPYPTLGPFKEIAREYDCLIIGSLWSGRQNLGFCLDSENLEIRPKIHPFGLESEHFNGGDFISPVSTKLGMVGLEVCYDLRFPEVARSLALQGADFLVTVAQFPAARWAHWRTLSLARAIENQMPHLACNFSAGGGSMIIDAWGDPLAEACLGEEMILGEMDLAMRDRIRRDIPCFMDRRPEIY
jgi:predicted amidohydrolase